MSKSPSSTHAILLSGRSGVGKSTIAYEITHKLSQRDIPHVHIDGDNLDAMYPPQGPNGLMFLTNLAALWNNYYNSGRCRTLLLSGTGMVFQHEAIREVLEKVMMGSVGEGEEVRVDGVILTAEDETVVRRLEGREIGSGLERHLESSKRMARVLDEFVGMENLWRVRTDGRGVGDVAEEIIRVVLD